MVKLRVNFSLAIILALILSMFNIHDANSQVLSDKEMDSIRALLPYMQDDTAKLSTLYKVSRGQSSMDTIIKYSLATYYLAKRLNNSRYVASACELIGWYYNTTGNYSLSPKYFKEASEIYNELNLPISQAMMHSGIGDAYIGLGRFEEGISQKLVALKMFDQQNDLGRAALIYRTIGRACTEFLQYKAAMEFLDKALLNDIAINDTRSMGRDYFYLGQNINLYSSHNELGSKMLAKDFLLQAIRLQDANYDAIFRINSCAQLSLIYNDLLIATNNWDYADSSLYYYKIGKASIEESGYRLFDNIYEIAHAELTMLSGNYVSALKTLQQKFNDKTLHPVELLLLNQAFKLYYHYNNDYKGLYELMERTEISRKKMFITEFALELSKINKIKELEEQLAMIDLGAKTRDKEFEVTQQNYSTVRFIITVLLTFVTAIIIVFLYQLRRDLKYSKKLREQTEELQAANEELRTLMNESQQQSDLISRQTMEMKRQRNKLASYNLRIVINLDIASRFQASLMPSQDTMKRIFNNIFVLWRPLEEVSGDFYWGTEIGGHKFVAIADCTGHGIPGASLSMLGISFLNSIVARIDLNNVNAAEVLSKLRDRIAESLTRGSVRNEDIHDGMDIAVCIFDSNNSKLSYSGAYRPLWIVNNGELTEYKADKMPIAVDHDRTMPFTNNEIMLRPNDCVYIFSDGITDQFGIRENGKISKLKPKRLRELVCRISDLAPENQKEEIISMIDKWRGSTEQTDDIMMIGIKN